MSDNTYGSNDLRCIRVTDINGSHVRGDTILLNIYDYWIGRIYIMKIAFIFVKVGTTHSKKSLKESLFA